MRTKKHYSLTALLGPLVVQQLRKLWVFLVVVVLFTTVTSRGKGQTMLIDDFNDGIDDGWSISDSPLATPGTRDASSGAYLLESVSSVSGPASVGSVWDASTNPIYSDGFLRVTVRANSPESDIALVLRNNSTPTVAENYSFLLSQSAGGQLLILSIDTSNSTTPFVQLASTPISFASGEYWMLEAGAVGNELSLKAWRVGDPQPVAPQLTITDSTYTIGSFGLAAAVSPGMTGQASGTFDDVYFTPPVPEPSEWLLFALATPALALFSARRSARRKATQVN